MAQSKGIKDMEVINLGPGQQLYKTKELALQHSPGEGYVLRDLLNGWWVWEIPLLNPWEMILKEIEALKARVRELELK